MELCRLVCNADGSFQDVGVYFDGQPAETIDLDPPKEVGALVRVIPIHFFSFGKIDLCNLVVINDTQYARPAGNSDGIVVILDSDAKTFHVKFGSEDGEVLTKPTFLGPLANVRPVPLFAFGDAANIRWAFPNPWLCAPSVV